jgi:hypothetical protein
MYLVLMLLRAYQSELFYCLYEGQPCDTVSCTEPLMVTITMIRTENVTFTPQAEFEHATIRPETEYTH